MIPYDELVIALQTWRAKQGLPVAQLSGALTPPPAVTAPAMAAPGRTAPPSAPPKGGFLGNVATPPPLSAPDEGLDVEEAALLEEASYENEGDDFVTTFGSQADDGESTSIGSATAPVGDHARRGCRSPGQAGSQRRLVRSI